ncbi:hypothetical protein GEMRC1_001226 [Eukaryota sp. GEM-RC1]
MITFELHQQISLELNHHDILHPLLNLKQDLLPFCEKLGYVSHHFFESALLSITVFFQSHTFHVIPKDLPELFSLASFFESEVQSVFLHLTKTFNSDEFLCCSTIITGLSICPGTNNDLEFLNNSSYKFPRLKQLDVRVESCISMSVIDLLKVNNTVTCLNLRDSSIGVEGARALANALNVNTTITSVDLGENCIGNEGVKMLADALKVNSTVIQINLLENHIGNDGAIALAKALQVNSTISWLDLWKTGIGNEGAIALAEAFKVNATVTRIDLGNNCIDYKGVIALTDALKVNSTVVHVGLSGNSIGNEGAFALAHALKINSTITQIDLSSNSIGNEGAVALFESLKVNDTVTHIRLYGNSIDCNSEQLISNSRLSFNLHG